MEPIFVSAAMRRVVALIEKVAMTTAPVVISGETGTGKEVLATLIHKKSSKRGSMVCVNCAALPRELIEAELFGSVRGAFTGAVLDRKGLFEHADGGTLLLDELTDMPLDLQAKLLRVLQDGEIRPVGSVACKKVSVRVIATLNRPPHEAVRAQMLREDLYYRLSTVWLNVPALRFRPEDVLPIASAALSERAAELGKVYSLSDSAQSLLRGYDWPGNVRQLLNEIHRATILSNTPVIEPSVFSASLASKNIGSTNTPIEESTRLTIVEALEATDGNILAAAKALGMGRQTLYNKMKQFGIGKKLRRLDIVSAANDEPPASGEPPA